MAEVQEKPRTRRPQARAVRKSAKPKRASHRGRGLRQPTEGVLADLDRMISALIKENRDLHRQIDKLSKLTVGAGLGSPSAPYGPSSAESAALWAGGGRAVAVARQRQHPRAGDEARSPIRNYSSGGAKRWPRL